MCCRAIEVGIEPIGTERGVRIYAYFRSKRARELHLSLSRGNSRFLPSVEMTGFWVIAKHKPWWALQGQNT